MCSRKHSECPPPVEKVRMAKPKKEVEKTFSRLDAWKKDVDVLKSFFGRFDENNPDDIDECASILCRIDDFMEEVEYSVASPEKQARCYHYEPRLSVSEKKNLEDIFVVMFTVIGDKLMETSDERVCSWLEETVSEICETYEMVYGAQK